ncbi:MAG: Spy/CpxP family protein refolding chaperone [Thermodesulfobacteriota bacterium]|nr:Spy/CpxP family protein refolding chaperone [Thermodesulfobacteriota bacterium]
MRKIVIALSLVVTMVLGAAYVYAQGGGRGPHQRGCPCWESGEPGKAAALTPEQRTKFQELRRKFNEETAKLRGDLLTKRLELQSLWTNPKADAKAIVDKEKELRDLQNQMRDKAVQFKLDARQFLTPEQIAGFGPGGRMGPGSGRGQMRGRGMGPGQGPCF